MSASGPSLPIGDVRFDGEFRRDSGLDVLTLSFVEIDPKYGLIDSCARRDFLSSYLETADTPRSRHFVLAQSSHLP